MADEHLPPGTVIAGRYEVVKCLGTGSMGLVYACRHRELPGHMVAVKVLFPEVAHDKVAAARFRNEIFASYGVSHPNVVRAYDYLRDGDLLAYTMEYVAGGDLAEKIGRPENLMPIPDAVRILCQICSGVQAIHDSGIVHRDLKPENILLTKDGNVKITDFGIARFGHGHRLTEHGGVVGTIDYVSPEYMLKSQVDWRSDIYAIGILGYEMVTGTSPFKGDSVYATMTKRLKSDPIGPSVIRPDCPTDLETSILKAMARDPEARYQSAADMWEDLFSVASRLGIDPGIVSRSSRQGSGRYVGPTLNPGDSSSESAGSDASSGEIVPFLTEDQKTDGTATLSVQDRRPPDHGAVKVLAGDSQPRQRDGGGIQRRVIRIEPVSTTESGAEPEPTQYADSRTSGVRDRAAQGERRSEPSGTIRLPLNRAGKAVPLEGIDGGITPPITNEERPILDLGHVVSPGSTGQSESGVKRGGALRLGPIIETPPEPQRQESVLEWRQPPPTPRYTPPPVEIRGGTIDERRVRILADEADRDSDSLWLNLLTIVLAVLTGIGVGFAVLKVYYPELLGIKKEVPAGFDISVIAEKAKDQ